MIVKSILADLKVQFHPIYEKVERSLQHYIADFEEPDLTLHITQQDIDFERKLDSDLPKTLKDRVVEKTAAFRKFAERLPDFDGTLFHSCFIKVENRGIAFSAPSGTGKTTHMLLWKKLLGEKLTIINGDKPLVRFVDGKLYGYGSPWVGKEGYGCNEKVPLTDICLIERSKTNKTEPLSKQEGMILLMQQIYMPFDSAMRMKTINLIYRIVENVNFWKISCNLEDEAAKISYETIIGNDKSWKNLLIKLLKNLKQRRK